MSCTEWQEAIGAMVDGEEPAIDPALIEQHIEKCSSCAAYREFAHRLRRANLHQAEQQPDLAPAIVKTAQIYDGIRTWSIARGILAICALEVVILSIRDLAGDDGSSVHISRHLGAFTMAFGVALIVVVIRPARARTMLPVAMVVAGALAITGFIDLLGGHVPLIHEALHIPELLSAAMIWILARPSGRFRHSTRRVEPAAGLRSAENLDETG
jgi:predicted anti-sigma-YlaC factor YlaD